MARVRLECFVDWVVSCSRCVQGLEYMSFKPRVRQPFCWPAVSFFVCLTVCLSAGELQAGKRVRLVSCARHVARRTRRVVVRKVFPTANILSPKMHVRIYSYLDSEGKASHVGFCESARLYELVFLFPPSSRSLALSLARCCCCHLSLRRRRQSCLSLSLRPSVRQPRQLVCRVD